MNNKTNVFLFTGQLRHKKKLIKSILTIKSTFLFKEILISTWNDEKKNKLFISLLKLLKVKLIFNESIDDPYNLKGNIFYQIKSMEYGLEQVPKTYFLFKSRTDLYIKPKALKRILKLDYTVSTNSILENKIWIPWFEATKLFYFGDECFYGKVSDLSKFISYENIYDNIGIDQGASHVRRFAYPYSKKDPYIISSLEKYGNSNYGKERFKTLQERLKDKDFLRYLSYYYELVKRDYRVGLEGQKEYIDFRKWSTGTVYPTSKNIYESLKKENACLTLGHIFIYSENWINNLEQFID